MTSKTINMPQLTKTQLSMVISRLKVFVNPDPKLEQYPLDSEIAASILWKCYMDGSLTTVADLGAGTGILGLGAALLGTKKVYMVDIDNNALQIAKENQVFLEKQFNIKLPITYVNSAVFDFDIHVDTVIENPPFGVQKEHADKKFLEKAFEIADNIYTLHTIESRSFIEKMANDHGFAVCELMKFGYPLKKSMEFHTKLSQKVKVGCWILRRII
jgi:putative methylase